MIGRYRELGGRSRRLVRCPGPSVLLERCEVRSGLTVVAASGGRHGARRVRVRSADLKLNADVSLRITGPFAGTANVDIAK